MSRSALAVGTFLRIRLADGSHAHGRAFEPPYVAFYSLRTNEPIANLDVLVTGRDERVLSWI
jgi:hypothetical protein